MLFVGKSELELALWATDTWRRTVTYDFPLSVWISPLITVMWRRRHLSTVINGAICDWRRMCTALIILEKASHWMPTACMHNGVSLLAFIFFCGQASKWKFAGCWYKNGHLCCTSLPSFSGFLCSYYRTVLISPRYANLFDPLAVCREQFKYLSGKGLAKLAL